MTINDDSVPFGSRVYWVMAGLLLFCRAMDLLSTRVATPNLAHEANPLARKLGWKWGQVMNVALSFLVAAWPMLAICLSTTSLLVAARNFKSAWIMRTMGEDNYGHFIHSVVSETRMALYVGCVAGESLLTIIVGMAVALYSPNSIVAMSVGIGIAAYGAVVGFYTLLTAWQMRHRMK